MTQNQFPDDFGLDPPALSESGLLDHVAELVALVNTGAPQFVDRLVARHQEALSSIADRGFPPSDEPRHPLAAGFWAYRQLLAGRSLTGVQTDLGRVATYALALRRFRQGWHGYEPWLARRLQDRRNAPGAVFELLTALSLTNRNYSVEYVAPSRSASGIAGGDLVVHTPHGDLEVECTFMEADAGQAVSVTTGMWLWRQTAREMERTATNRVLFVQSQGRVTKSEAPTVASALKRALSEDTAPEAPGLSVEVCNGGEPARPLTAEEFSRLTTRLQLSPAAWGVSIPRSRTIAVPGTPFLRGLSIRSQSGDHIIRHLVNMALAKAKSDQLAADRPNLVVVGFGRPVLRRDELAGAVGMALKNEAQRVFRNRSRISGAVFSFDYRWESRPSRLFIGAYDNPILRVFLRSENPRALPFPEGFEA